MKKARCLALIPCSVNICCIFKKPSHCVIYVCPLELNITSKTSLEKLWDITSSDDTALLSSNFSASFFNAPLSLATVEMIGVVFAPDSWISSVVLAVQKSGLKVKMHMQQEKNIEWPFKYSVFLAAALTSKRAQQLTAALLTILIYFNQVSHLISFIMSRYIFI